MGIIDPSLAEVETLVLVKRIDTVPVAVALSVIAAILLSLLLVWLIIVYKHRPSARAASVLSMATTIQPGGHRRGQSITTSAAVSATRQTNSNGSTIISKSTTRDSEAFSLQVHERLVRDVYRYPSSSTSTLLTTAELQDKVSVRGDTASMFTNSVASRSVFTLETRTAVGTNKDGTSGSDNESAMASPATKT